MNWLFLSFAVVFSFHHFLDFLHSFTFSFTFTSTVINSSTTPKPPSQNPLIHTQLSYNHAQGHILFTRAGLPGPSFHHSGTMRTWRWIMHRRKLLLFQCMTLMTWLRHKAADSNKKKRSSGLCQCTVRSTYHPTLLDKNRASAATRLIIAVQDVRLDSARATLLLPRMLPRPHHRPLVLPSR